MKGGGDWTRRCHKSWRVVMEVTRCRKDLRNRSHGAGVMEMEKWKLESRRDMCVCPSCLFSLRPVPVGLSMRRHHGNPSDFHPPAPTAPSTVAVEFALASTPVCSSHSRSMTRSSPNCLSLKSPSTLCNQERLELNKTSLTRTTLQRRDGGGSAGTENYKLQNYLQPTVKLKGKRN